MATQEKQRPLATYRAGKLMKASIWKNEGTGDKGQKYEFMNVQLQKSWTTDNGKTFENKDISLSVDEIPKAIAALQEAYRHCLIVKEEA